MCRADALDLGAPSEWLALAMTNNLRRTNAILNSNTGLILMLDPTCVRLGQLGCSLSTRGILRHGW